ncbi:M24 family metallopeptidase [Streptomyces mirabilis]|uniref:M24 family metallopeptidase n=1 Tax=Streptomyces mirabilis TaxID=68239 RepID=UPI0033F5E0D9
MATRELLKSVPLLPLEERDRRWNRLRKRMLMADVKALVFLGNDIYWDMGMANLKYVFQVDSNIGADGLFCLDGEPVVWSTLPYMNRPTSQDWISDVRDRGGMDTIAEELRARGLDRSRIGLVSFSSSVQVTPTLLHRDMLDRQRVLPNVTWVDANHLLQEMRMVKSEAEIDMLRAAGKIARLTVDALVDSARPGVPGAAVYDEMIRTQIAHGADPNVFILFSASPLEHDPNEPWHVLHHCDHPPTPSTRPLQDGDLIVTEWHTKYGGYRCHTEYTVYVGKRAPDQLLRLWDVAWECLEASRSALTTGRTIREALEILRLPARKADVDWAELGFHAMGLESPEFPTVVYENGRGNETLNGHNISDLVLETGMAFGNNIDLHDSTWRPDIGVMLSDFMVVRPDQAECLVGTPREIAQTG